MDEPNRRKLISNAFSKLHEQISLVRTHVEAMEDSAAEDLMEAMEIGLLAPMRKLRLRLDIPYDWHERRESPVEEGA
jgi:hypothetical protein